MPTTSRTAPTVVFERGTSATNPALIIATHALRLAEKGD